MTTKPYEPNEFLAVSTYTEEIHHSLDVVEAYVTALRKIPEISLGGQATAVFHLQLQPTHQLTPLQSINLREQINTVLGIQLKQENPNSPFWRSTLIFGSGLGCIHFAMRDGLPTQQAYEVRN